MQGYVRLVNNMGTELDIVNAARVSFDREVKELSLDDERLIRYLVRNKHDSCLRHNVMTFEVYAPLMVARQWYKHVIGSAHLDDQHGWNETSRRYVTEQEEFYQPAVWRLAAQNKKQGSAGNADMFLNAKYRKKLDLIQKSLLSVYKEALRDGIAPEQARLFLPAYGLMIRWRWTASLNAVLHFLSLRTDEHAQAEIQHYAKEIEYMVKHRYPTVYDAWSSRV